MFERRSKILAIFCDASIYQEPNRFVGFAGAIAVLFDRVARTAEIIDHSYKVLDNSSNNRSEMTAISLAIQLVDKYKGQFGPSKFIPIFSDSKLCVFSLREWIFNWVRTYWKHSSYNQLMTSSNTPVANQDLMMSILNYVLSNRLEITLYHCKGHVTASKASINHAKKTFYASNGIMLNDDDVKTISYYNNMIDATTGDIIEYYKAKQLAVIFDMGYTMDQPIITMKQLNRYGNLINR